MVVQRSPGVRCSPFDQIAENLAATNPARDNPGHTKFISWKFRSLVMTGRTSGITCDGRFEKTAWSSMKRCAFSVNCRARDLVIAMIADRAISPGSKLSCPRGMNRETAQSTLSDELCLGDVDRLELHLDSAKFKKTAFFQRSAGTRWRPVRAIVLAKTGC